MNKDPAQAFSPAVCLLVAKWMSPSFSWTPPPDSKLAKVIA